MLDLAVIASSGRVVQIFNYVASNLGFALHERFVLRIWLINSNNLNSDGKSGRDFTTGVAEDRMTGDILGLLAVVLIHVDDLWWL